MLSCSIGGIAGSAILLDGCGLSCLPAQGVGAAGWEGWRVRLAAAAAALCKLGAARRQLQRSPAGQSKHPSPPSNYLLPSLPSPACRSYAYVQLPPPALTPGLQRALPSQPILASASRKGASLAPDGRAATASATATPGSMTPGDATPAMGHGHGSEVQLVSNATL